MSKNAPILRIEVDRRYIAQIGTDIRATYTYRVKVFRQGSEDAPRTYRPSCIQRLLIDNYWSEQTDSGPNRTTREYYAGNGTAKRLSDAQVALLIRTNMDTVESYNYYTPTAKKLANLGYIRNDAANTRGAIVISPKGRKALEAWCNHKQGTTTGYPEAIKLAPSDVLRLGEHLNAIDGRMLLDWKPQRYRDWNHSTIQTGVELRFFRIVLAHDKQLELHLTSEARSYMARRALDADRIEQEREQFEAEWREELSTHLNRAGCTLKADRASVAALHLSWPSGVYVDTFYHDKHVTEFGVGIDDNQNLDSTETRQLAADLQYAATAIDTLNRALRMEQEQQS